MLVYDLGLTPAQRWEAGRWCGASLPWLPGALGRLAAVAPHVGELQQYAWKPLALADALRRHAAVLWLDAGNTVRAPPVGRGAGARGQRAAAEGSSAWCSSGWDAGGVVRARRKRWQLYRRRVQ